MKSIKTKLAIVFFLLNILVVIIGIYSSNHLNKASRVLKNTYTGPLQTVNFSREVQNNFLSLLLFFERNKNNEGGVDFEAFNEVKELFDENILIVEEAVVAEEETLEIIRNIERNVNKWAETAKVALELSVSEDQLQALKNLSDETYVLLEDLIEVNMTSGFELISMTGYSVEQAYRISIFIFVVGIIMSTVCIILLSRSIVKPILNIQSIFDQIMSTLNLTHRVKSSSKDEIGRVTIRINDLLSMFQDALINFNETSTSVVEKTAYLKNLMGKTIEQYNTQKHFFSQIDETIGEVNNTHTHISQHMQKSLDLANHSEKECIKGKKLVDRSLSESKSSADGIKIAAKEIKDLAVYSKNINSVIDVINTISDQTNLLALNAAIEAARAGDVGRGFAVVADEIRSLSKETNDSTALIKDNIGGLQQCVTHVSEQITINAEKSNQALQLSEEVAGNFNSIVQAIESIKNITDEISYGCDKAKSHTENADALVKKISTFVKENYDVSSKTEQECVTLKHQSEKMLELVKKFTI